MWTITPTKITQILPYRSLIHTLSMHQECRHAGQVSPISSAAEAQTRSSSVCSKCGINEFNFPKIYSCFSATLKMCHTETLTSTVLVVTLTRFYRWLVARRSLNIFIIFLLPSPKIEPGFYASESNEWQIKQKISKWIMRDKINYKTQPNRGTSSVGRCVCFHKQLKIQRPVFNTVSQPLFSCTADKTTYTFS